MDRNLNKNLKSATEEIERATFLFHHVKLLVSRFLDGLETEDDIAKVIARMQKMISLANSMRKAIDEFSTELG